MFYLKWALNSQFRAPRNSRNNYSGKTKIKNLCYLNFFVFAYLIDKRKIVPETDMLVETR